MKVFIPAANDQTQAERVYEATKKFVPDQTSHPISDRRIYSMGFRHDGVMYTATVSEVFERLGEPVVALFEGYIFYLCTVNRAVLLGEPYLIGREEVQWIKQFESDTTLKVGR